MERRNLPAPKSPMSHCGPLRLLLPPVSQRPRESCSRVGEIKSRQIDTLKRIDALLVGRWRGAGQKLGRDVGGAGLWIRRRVSRRRHHQAGRHLDLLWSEGRRREQVRSRDPGREKASGRGEDEALGQACRLLPPSRLSSAVARPPARAPPPGKAERRQGDDAGPRGEHHLAAARLHQDVLDDVLQQRLLQVGERREPAGGAGVSAATRHAQRSPRAASVLRREPRALRGFSLNSSPSQRYEASLFQFYRHSNCCLRGPSCRTSCCWYKWWDSNPGIGRPHLGASFGERHLAMTGCRGTGAPESPPRQRPQSSPRGRWGKRWYFSPGSRKPFKRLGSLYPP